MSTKAYVRNPDTGEVIEIPINKFITYRGNGYARATKKEHAAHIAEVKAQAEQDADAAPDPDAPSTKPLEEQNIKELKATAKALGLVDLKITKATRDEAIAAIVEAQERKDAEGDEENENEPPQE